MKIYSSNSCQKPWDTNYSNEFEIKDDMPLEEREQLLKQAFARDYTCARLKDGVRLKTNFLSADCVGFDVDNEHSEDPNDWVTPADIRRMFPDVRLIVHFSRNHLKEKDGKPARPKFHVLFLVDEIDNVRLYESMKKTAFKICPYFDSNALDAVRMFFGTPDPQIEIFDGSMKLTEFFEKNDIGFNVGKAVNADVDIDNLPDGPLGQDEPDKEVGRFDGGPILEGERNATLFVGAVCALKRLGNSIKARKLFDEATSRCIPPLDENEIERIWRNAVRYAEHNAQQKGYIPPEEYDKETSLRPEDFTDLGQAKVIARAYGNIIRYSPATGFLCYNGAFWTESNIKGQELVQIFTDRQLKEAERGIFEAESVLEDLGLLKAIKYADGRGLRNKFNEEEAAAYARYEEALTYRKFVLAHRNSANISSTIKELKPLIQIDPKELDSNPFLLNTPSLTIDLKQGIESARLHAPHDYLTKQTAMDPSDKGSDLWLDALNKFFCGDEELIEYVQRIAGLAAIGTVKVEFMVIAYGDGRNGKSTFWNSMAHVLGSYSGTISPDILTKSCRRNPKPEMAELRGKRIVIAAELEEGTRLSSSMVKQICSTDDVKGEKKYKDPLDFKPSHTLIMYTNFLPRVGSLDDGTWRRLVVVPFDAHISGRSDIKNYTEYLFENAGGAILSWIIEGARKIIAEGYWLEMPAAVKRAIEAYSEENNWLKHFLEEECDVAPTLTEKSGALFSAYREYCERTGEYYRSTTDFYSALSRAGFGRRRNSSGSVVYGLKLRERN